MLGTPMWRAAGDLIDSRTTWAAAEIEIRSRSSLRALTRIGFQKRSIAFGVWPCWLHQSRNERPVVGCDVRVSAARAREITSLSFTERNGKRKNDGAVCRGAGSGEACITLVRPPGSMKVISSNQRIL